MDADPRPVVVLQPLGPVATTILQHLAINIERLCQLSCSVEKPMGYPSHAFDADRQQYRCKQLLVRLQRCSSPDCCKVLGVTEQDLFVPILKYVFGAAQMDGKCAVISLHRLRPEYYGDKENEELFLERLVKTAIHELGHSLGLTHCRRRSCVMYSSTRIEDTDIKEPTFCPTCRELFRWRLENSG